MCFSLNHLIDKFTHDEVLINVDDKSIYLCIKIMSLTESIKVPQFVYFIRKYEYFGCPLLKKTIKINLYFKFWHTL